MDRAFRKWIFQSPIGESSCVGIVLRATSSCAWELVLLSGSVRRCVGLNGSPGSQVGVRVGVAG